MAGPSFQQLNLGFASYYGDWQTNQHRPFHQHNEVELDLILAGRVTYELGGKSFSPIRRRAYCFWSAVPHRVVRLTLPVRIYSISVPTPWVLQYHLPSPILARLFHGECFSEPTNSADELMADSFTFCRWHKMMHGGSVESRRIVMLEVEARIRRLLLDNQILTARLESPHPTAKVAQMIQYLTEHYTEPLHVAQVAALVGLSPKYVITQFRKTCGVSLMDYLNQLRVYHAQRLLATTEKKIMDVAYASGFGSVSQFHAIFKRNLKISPQQFRQQLQLHQRD
ncbi:MAG: Melibiose operon regulatory protein [Verrucomicrobiae bacterium]|nr:Melibiose operon regulatory protein [Verrucomicrobiae bacterium]